MTIKKDRVLIGYLSGSLASRCDNPPDLFLNRILTYLTKTVKQKTHPNPAMNHLRDFLRDYCAIMVYYIYV